MTGTDGPWAWIERLQRFGVHPGLERTRALLAALGDPQRGLEVALVAGTNGKGSTTALLDAMLRADPASGERVARFISPHLMRFDERFWVAGRPVPAAALEAVLAEVRPVAERLGATFFEVLVAVALVAFARAGAQRAVLEVGLGGRLDATNATEPTLSVITQVALDHEAILGPDLAAIAGEKAGILRPGVAAVTSAEGAALAVLRRRAQELGTPLTVLDDTAARIVDCGWDGVEVRGLGPSPVRASLLGAHQARNLATAALAARAWGVPWPAIVQGAAVARWPGRLEPIAARGVRWLLDGAHNPAGARALGDALDHLGAAPSVAVLGVSDDRLDGPLLEGLAGLAPALVAVSAAWSPRAAPAASVAAGLRAAGVHPERITVAAMPAAALDLAAAAARAERDRAGGRGGPRRGVAPDDQGSPPTVVVAGSLYLVGEVRAHLLGDAVEPFERWQ